MDRRDSVSLFSDTRYAPWWLFIGGWSMLFSSDQLSRFKPPATIPTLRVDSTVPAAPGQQELTPAPAPSKWAACQCYPASLSPCVRHRLSGADCRRRLTSAIGKTP